MDGEAELASQLGVAYQDQGVQGFGVHVVVEEEAQILLLPAGIVEDRSSNPWEKDRGSGEREPPCGQIGQLYKNGVGGLT